VDRSKRMNPIHRFVLQNNPLSLPVLLNAFFRLSILQMTQGKLSFTDIRSSVGVASADKFHEEEQMVYAGILYETVLIPCLTEDGPKLCMIEEMVGKQKEFLECLFNRTMYYEKKMSTNGMSFSSLENLKGNIDKILKKEELILSAVPLPSSSSFSSPACSSVVPHVTASRQLSEASYKCSGEPHPFDDSTYASPHAKDSRNELFASDEMRTEHTTQLCADYKTEQSLNINLPPSAELDSSRSGPINQLLAHLRKSGMDILSPQVVHDKVSL
jgi:hypothetical protein